MKKTLTAMFCVSMLATAAMAQDLTFTAPQLPGTGQMYTILDTYKKSVSSQVIIPASYFKDFDSNLEVSSIGLTVGAGVIEYAAKDPKPAKIWIGQTDQTAFAERTPLPESEMTLVYEGDITFEPSKEQRTYTYTFNKPYVIDPSKSIVLTFWNEGDNDSYNIWMRSENTGNTNTLYCYSTSDNTTNIWNAPRINAQSQIPCVTFGYKMAAQPDVLDMAAVSMTVPTDAVKVGEEASFRVQLKNEGNVDVEECSVELLSIVEGQEPVVLATKAVEDYFAAGMTANVNLKYAFTKGGEYKVAARVKCDGDTKADNNTTPEYSVTVESTDVCDLTVSSFVAPEKMTEDVAAEFKVGVKNIGTVAAAYTVQIEDAQSNEIFGTASPNHVLNPGDEDTVPVEATVKLAGNYNVVAHVIAAADETVANDFSTPVQIVVEKQNGISEIAADFVAGAKAVTVADLNGRIVANSIENLPAGVYVVSVKTADGKVKTAKFIVK